MISKRSLILGAGAAYITRRALAAPLPSLCRGPFNARKIGPVNPQCLAVSNGLVGYWPLGPDTTDFHQGVTSDASGNGNTGTLTGLPATSLAQGPIGPALAFNGSSSRVTAGVNGIPTGASAISVSAWINQTTNTAQNAIISIEGASGKTFSLISYLSGGPAAYIFTDSVAFNFQLTPTTLLPPLGVWCNLTLTYDGTTLRYYLNGSLMASAAATLNTVSPLTAVYIGGRVNGGVYYFNGSISGAAAWNRTLAPWEVQQLYQAGNAGSRTPYPYRKAI